MNNQPIRQAINEATDKLTRLGWQDADQSSVMLAGFGYLADRIEEGRIVIKLSGGRVFAAGLFVGGSLTGALMKVLS